MKLSGLALVVSGIVMLAAPVLAQNVNRGAQAYKLCASCHGFDGEGNQLIKAPALAGREDWYLTRQIRNFRRGMRGNEQDDHASRSMATMTRALEDEQEVLDVVAYIRTLPAPVIETTLDGNPGAGRSAYVPCSACHGANAEGNAALNAPGLTGVEDWYQFAQLTKFRDGTRGALPGDTYGMQMVPMAQQLADDQALKDVIAFIATLR